MARLARMRERPWLRRSRAVSSLWAAAGKRWVVFGALGLVLGAYGTVVASGLWRPGYSIDEEFTLVAVQGIRAHGFPFLPSGALENRGLPYTYMAWLSGTLFGHGFPAYRIPSLICGVVSIALIFKLASFSLGPGGALVTVIVVALLPWQILSAQWARFYSMFLACSLWSLLLFWRDVKTGRGVRLWAASVALAHLLHDFAVMLVLLPGIAAVIVPARRRPALRPFHMTMLAAGAFLASEAAMYGLHMLTSAEAFTRTPYGYAVLHALPISWETVIRTPPTAMSYPFLARVVDLDRVIAILPVVFVGSLLGMLLAMRLGVARVFGFACGLLAGLTEFARLWFVTAIWAFSQPTTAARTVAWGIAAVTIAAVAQSVAVSWTTGAAFTTPFVLGMLTFAMRELASVGRGLVSNYPITAASMVVVGITLARRHTSAAVRFPRVLFLWVLWWLLVFDVLAVQIRPRYYVALWPLIVLAIMHAPRVIPMSWFRNARVAGVSRLVVSTALAIAISWEQYAAADENRVEHCLAGNRFCVPAMLTYDAPDLARLAREVRPTDTVLCSDELLCTVLIGRLDYWLYTGAIYTYQVDGGEIGLYGGSRIIRNAGALQAVLLDDPSRSRFWIILPTLRKYPTWTLEEVLNTIPETMRAGAEITQTPRAVIVHLDR